MQTMLKMSFFLPQKCLCNICVYCKQVIYMPSIEIIVLILAFKYNFGKTRGFLFFFFHFEDWVGVRVK